MSREQEIRDAGLPVTSGDLNQDAQGVPPAKPAKAAKSTKKTPRDADDSDAG